MLIISTMHIYDYICRRSVEVFLFLDIAHSHDDLCLIYRCSISLVIDRMHLSSKSVMLHAQVGVD